MTNKKMSYASAIDYVLSGAELTDEVRERLEALKASLQKRYASKTHAPTKTQIANAAIVEQIGEAMEAGVEYTTADIAGLVPELAGATPQKVTPLMRKLMDAGKVVAEKVKGKKVYHLA